MAARLAAAALLLPSSAYAADCTASTLAGWSTGCMQDVGMANAVLHWKVSGSSVSFTLSATAGGYVALGFPVQGTASCAMIGATAVAGSSATPVTAYKLEACGGPSSAAVDAAQTITDTSASINAGTTTIAFTRAVNNGNGPALVIGSMELIFAYHSTTGDPLNGGSPVYHDGRTKFTADLSATPRVPTASPSSGPTASPVVPPTKAPLKTGTTGAPSGPPSASPAKPTSAPSKSPAKSPSASPTMGPSATPPKAGSCTKSDLATTAGGSATYSCMKTLTTGVNLHWSVRADGKADVGVDKTGSSGWVSLGFPSTLKQMVGAEAYTVAGSAGDWWYLGGKSSSAITKRAPTKIVVGSAAGSVEGGKQVIRLTAVPTAADILNAVWGMHGSGSFPGTIHNTMGSAAVNVKSGATTTTTSATTDKSLVKTHGVLLLIGWCFLAPVAALIKRFPVPATERKVGKYPLLFLLHAGLMFTAGVFTIVAFMIAWRGFEGDGEPDYAHGTIGALVFFCVIIQVLMGAVARPEKDSPWRPKFNYAHWTLGTVCLVLGMTNVLTGAENYSEMWDKDEAQVFSAFATVGIVLGVVGFIAGSIRQQRQKANPAPKFQESTFQQGTQMRLL
eukprot:TRINITY_DN32076_c0_g1_i1.p1 TRINITY_DN32076_c0_g1~~TRINITY_DN32076_c0_g1_i1.p1  ORF type:complete len:619 (+),score=177.69 TRINITY_DN32076_c0_g1_i1:52-1908(+)